MANAGAIDALRKEVVALRQEVGIIRGALVAEEKISEKEVKRLSKLGERAWAGGSKPIREALAEMGSVRV